MQEICGAGEKLDLVGGVVLAVPPRVPRYTLTDWQAHNHYRYRCAESQHQLADRIVGESERALEEAQERTSTNKLETEHQLRVKIGDIEFIKSQVFYQKREMDKEIDTLVTYRERILDAQNALGTKALEICKRCVILREGRRGVDLCVDEVEDELNREAAMLDGCRSMYVRLFEQVNEQLRRLRAMNYSLGRDLEDKGEVVKIDELNLRLKETDSGLTTYHGAAPLDPANITQEEWVAHSQGSIDAAHKELVSGRPLRAYIDTLLKQIVEDLWRQYDTVNLAFSKRIADYKETKAKLENQRFETVRQVNEMTMTVARLERAVAEKEPFMALAHTRLGNRCQRAGVELCRDEVETYLVNEVIEIRETVKHLQHMLAQAKASLRYLLRTQLQLEEEIDIKTNSIKIDEVECLTLRQGMDYRSY